MIRTHPKDPSSPFSFDDREFWRPIYREFGPTVIEKTLVILGSRKFDKTEFLLNMILYAMCGFEAWNLLYTIGRRGQVRAFSEKRFLPAIRTSNAGWLKELFVSNPTGILNRSFKTSNPDVFNTLTLDSSWSKGRGLLGEETQFNIYDEFQDQETGTFANVAEMQTQSPFKWVIAAGTARTGVDELGKLWKISTRNLWVVTCPKCGKDQVFGKKENKTGMGVQNIFKIIDCEDCGERNIIQGYKTVDTFQCKCGKTHGGEIIANAYKGCAFCKTPLDERTGKWVETNPGAIYIGYRANQIMHPAIDAISIYIKLLTYPRFQFINEVLGEFYAGSGGGITINDIMKCAKRELEYLYYSEGRNVVMGVDTGKPIYITIMDADHNRILWQESKELEDSVERKKYFMELINRYNVGQIVIDFGEVGRVLAKDLQIEYADRVKTCRYTSRVGNWFDYKRIDKQGNPIYRMEVDKVTIVLETIQKVKNGIYKFPFGDKSQEKAEEVFKQYQNLIPIPPESDETQKATASIPRIKLEKRGPEHYLDTLVYCELATKNQKKEVSIRIVGQNVGSSAKKKRIQSYVERIRNSTRRL